MPLRQSTLSFARSPATAPTTTKRSLTADTRPKQITPPAEDVDEDTIVVVLPDESHDQHLDHEPEQADVSLPTPSESATDVSSQSSGTPKTKVQLKTRSRRVSSTKKAPYEERLFPARAPSRSNLAPNKRLRNISGDTLVADASLSHTSLVKNGVDKLDLRWNMSLDFGQAAEEPQRDGSQDKADGEDTISLVAQEEQSASAKQRLKAEARKQKWEQRKKTADRNATRRSSRASLLVSKATEMMSEIATGVLGKRSRAKDHKQDATSPTSKKARLSTSGQVVQKQDDGVSLSATNRALETRAPKDKKWLTSGLYAGQSRSFDPAKSEGQNKRKSIKSGDAPLVAVTENSVLPLPMFAGARLLETGRDFRLPFDVFSPLPPGQPKPDEWRRVNKNVFVGDAAAEWRTNKFSEQSTCLCTAERGCDSDCMNRFMYYECDSRNCNLSEEQCGNRAFEGLRKRVKSGGQYNVGVEVLRTLDRGYGVRACRTFEPNQIIVEYTGEIITQEECESRMHGLYKDNECYYLMAFDQNMIIDATRGSIARFVNHSCDPNCRMEKWTVGGKPRMALFASDRGIMTGEELTYDYNFDPYSQKNVQVCRCGADNCRGVLGPKPKELPKKEKESALAGAKRKLVEVLEEGKDLMTGSKKRKTEEKKLPKGWVYLEPEVKPKSTRKSAGDQQAPEADVDGSLSRRPSKLKRMLSNKSKSGRSITSVSRAGTITRRQSRRIASSNSTGSGIALLPSDGEGEEVEASDAEGEPSKEQASRPTSKNSNVATLKAKAGTIKGRVRRSLRGR